jgi:hypothetical protein
LCIPLHLFTLLKISTFAQIVTSLISYFVQFEM